MNLHIGLGTAMRRQNTPMLRFGLILVEWGIARGFEPNQEEEMLLASCHCTIWVCEGVKADLHNMDRSIELYTKIYPNYLEIYENPTFLINFGKALSYRGLFDKSYAVFELLSQKFEDHKEIPNFMFYAGCSLKALGRHDEAANYFFEATQIGPPKLFSKLEMMFIISRNIEQGMKNKDVPLADAYEMVYEHVILEGELDAEVSYDEWVSDAMTWRTLGDKCILHGQYSLGADLYGQGIVRDRNSFRKVKLWYSFAKSCNRCGRTSDAQLSIKVILNIEIFCYYIIFLC